MAPDEGSPSAETDPSPVFASRSHPLPQGEREKQKGGPKAALFYHTRQNSVRAVGHGLGAVTPDVDADEQEQPNHVDEMPVPGGEFEAQVLGRRKVPGIGAEQADQEEDGADQHMETVKTGRHEEGRAIDVAGK